MHARLVQRVLSWRDAASASIIYLVLVVLTIVLVLVPWDVVVPFCIRWGARLLGLVLLGPQWYWIGLRTEQALAEQAAQQERHHHHQQQQVAKEKDKEVNALAPAASTSASWLFEISSVRTMPRKPCLPDVAAPYSFRPVAD